MQHVGDGWHLWRCISSIFFPDGCPVCFEVCKDVTKHSCEHWFTLKQCSFTTLFHCGQFVAANRILWKQFDFRVKWNSVWFKKLTWNKTREMNTVSLLLTVAFEQDVYAFILDDQIIVFFHHCMIIRCIMCCCYQYCPYINQYRIRNSLYALFLHWKVIWHLIKWPDLS